MKKGLSFDPKLFNLAGILPFWNLNTKQQEPVNMALITSLIRGKVWISDKKCPVFALGNLAQVVPIIHLILRLKILVETSETTLKTLVPLYDCRLDYIRCIRHQKTAIVWYLGRSSAVQVFKFFTWPIETYHLNGLSVNQTEFLVELRLIFKVLEQESVVKQAWSVLIPVINHKSKLFIRSEKFIGPRKVDLVDVF